ISGGEDGFIRCWDIASQDLVTTFPKYRYRVLQVSLSRSGNTLIAVYGDNTVRIWDWPKRQELASHTLPSGRFSFALSHDGKILAVGRADVTLYRLPSMKPITTIKTTDFLISAIQYSPDGKLLAIGGTRGQISLWDTADFHRVGVMSGQMG